MNLDKHYVVIQGKHIIRRKTKTSYNLEYGKYLTSPKRRRPSPESKRMTQKTRWTHAHTRTLWNLEHTQMFWCREPTSGIFRLYSYIYMQWAAPGHSNSTPCTPLLPTGPRHPTTELVECEASATTQQKDENVATSLRTMRKSRALHDAPLAGSVIGLWNSEKQDSEPRLN